MPALALSCVHTHTHIHKKSTQRFIPETKNSMAKEEEEEEEDGILGEKEFVKRARKL